MPIIPSNIHDGRPRNKMDLDTYINQIKTFFNNLNEKISSKSRIKTFPKLDSIMLKTIQNIN